jgi:PAS domain S-box-containing protein
MNDDALILALKNQAKSLSLLYVEDDLNLCEHTQIILEDFFEDIVICHNGEDALKVFKERSFDIVLTDIVMPIMDGIEMSRAMKEYNSEQIIIVMSAYEETQYFLEFVDIGINNFVSKPPNSNELFSILLSASLKINENKKHKLDSLNLEKDLFESKELLRTIIDTVPVRIFWKDKESKYLGCNKLFANDAGLSDQSELIGKSDFELSWRDNAEAYISDDQEVINSKSNKLHYEERQTTPNGDTIWISTSKVVLYDNDNKVMGLLGSYIDITEQKKMIASMKEVEEALGYQAYHDVLTKLPNRLRYLQKLDEAISRAKRSENKIAVIFIDIDKFKDINDSLDMKLVIKSFKRLAID